MITIGNVSDKEWKHVKEISRLHNKNILSETSQDELNDYIRINKSELSTPLIVSVLLENVEISHTYIKDNLNHCQLIVEIIEETDFTGADIGLRGDIRKGMFIEFVKEILSSEEIE